MNIGDQVRALHSDEAGFITKIIDDKTIEIEIEDGFTIPILIKNVVLVKREESEYFDQNQQTPVENNIVKKSATHLGIYLAFIPVSENFVDLHFINNTDYELLITAHSVSEKSIKGEFSIQSNPKSHTLLNKWNIKSFEKWNALQIDLLYFQKQSIIYKSPLSKKIKFQAKSFFNNFKLVPLIEQKGYLYQLDLDAKIISSTLLSNSSSLEIQHVDVPESTIDLHAELFPSTEGMSSHEILSRQLQIFTQKLDMAVATGMSEITFIHGSGTGVLKANIHKLLSKRPHIAYFQDAQKNKFGYGATYVKIK